VPQDVATAVKFSVVIPTYNRAKLLQAALDSVLAQSWTDYEIIVVDDGSTDETSGAISRYGDPVRLFRQENQGPGAARNLGIAQARGEYVVFLDSDDRWFPWTLATYAEVIEGCDRPSIVMTQPVSFTDADKLAAIEQTPLRIQTCRDYFACPRAAQGSTAAVRVDVLRAEGGFVERSIYAEDCDLWLRLGTASGYVLVESPPLYAYRRHEDSAVSDWRRTYDGISHLIAQERAGRYPGDSSRRGDRLRILTTHVRPVSLACLRERRLWDAWNLYGRTFSWHVRLGRWRYLLGFPALALLRAIAPWSETGEHRDG